MAIKLFTSVALLMAASSVYAQSAVARSLAGCGILSGNVFCYGGVEGNITAGTSTDTTMYMLDLSKNATMSELAENWLLVQPNTNGVSIETRLCPQSIQVSDTQIVFNGGYGGSGGNIPIVDQTIAYDSSTNSWSKYASYSESPYGDRQIYYGASAFVPGKGAVFYGGFEEHINVNWTITTNQNLTATTFSTISRVVGFTEATFLNINSTSVWNVPTPQSNAPSVFSAFQSSVYSPYDGRIYYLGGTYQNTTVPGYQPSVFANWHPLTYTLYFDTNTNTWGNQTLTGSVIPTNRRYHTTTILPSNQTQLLLYGGENENAVVDDFAFVLDLTTFKWTQLSFPVTNDGADLKRSRHSDILVDNNTLLLVFGFNSQGQSTSRPLQFNITSSSSIAYMSQYVAPASVANTSEGGNGSSGLSSGAIAGIVVAIVVAVIIAAVVAFFYIRRKKNAIDERREARETEQNFASADNAHEAMEVNWDEIEKQYVEIPQPESYKPNEFSSDTTDETTTFVQSNGSQTGHKQYVPNLVQIPDEGQPTPYLIMKPDGGH